MAQKLLTSRTGRKPIEQCELRQSEGHASAKLRFTRLLSQRLKLKAGQRFKVLTDGNAIYMRRTRTDGNVLTGDTNGLLSFSFQGYLNECEFLTIGQKSILFDAETAHGNGDFIIKLSKRKLISNGVK